MFRKATKVAARQHITRCAHRTLRSNLFDKETVFDKELEEEFGWMITYSPFDPCSYRPIPLPVRNSMVIQMPTALLGFKTSETENGVEAVKETKKGEAIFKPWPYSLPSFLQPKDGTTFSLVNGSSTTHTKHTGVLQAILYGVPDPERFSYKRELVAPGSLLHKILYGIKEMDDGEGIVPVSSVTVAKIEDEAMGEDKAGRETKIIVVKNVGVKVEVEHVMEKNSDMRHGMIAK